MLSNDQISNAQNAILTTEEMDTIGEVMNISMGASATAISSLLDKQVVITTPTLNLQKVQDVNYSDLEPAMVVKIEFIKGLSGTNIMVFRRNDMQIILNLLMGSGDTDVDESFEFDDMSISAACEVTNQMMGAAATALSEILGETVDISTPVASVAEPEHAIDDVMDVKDKEDDIVTISFDLSIKGVMNSNFMSVMPIEFAKGIVNHLMQGQDIPPLSPDPVIEEVAPPPQDFAPIQPVEQPAVAPPQAQQPMMNQQPAMQQPVMNQQPAMGQPQMQQPAMNQQPAMGQPQMQQPMMNQQPAMGQPQMQQPMMNYPMMDPQQMAMMQQYLMAQQQMQSFYRQPSEPSFAGPMGNMVGNENPVKVKKAKFPDFSVPGSSMEVDSNTNMGLLMNVPLEVSVEIGRTKRKIKEIADFGQGTVIELEKQAGALVDVIVNGQLIAHGDVVVIGDNFGVRITEIVGTKELMNSLQME